MCHRNAKTQLRMPDANAKCNAVRLIAWLAGWLAGYWLDRKFIQGRGQRNRKILVAHLAVVEVREWGESIHTDLLTHVIYSKYKSTSCIKHVLDNTYIYIYLSGFEGGNNEKYLCHVYVGYDRVKLQLTDPSSFINSHPITGCRDTISTP